MQAGKGKALFRAHSGVSGVSNLACFSQERWPGPGGGWQIEAPNGVACVPGPEGGLRERSKALGVPLLNV